MHIRPRSDLRPRARAVLIKQPRGLPRASLTMPAPPRGHAHSRITAGGIAARSRLTRSNAPTKGFHPVRTLHARHLGPPLL